MASGMNEKDSGDRIMNPNRYAIVSALTEWDTLQAQRDRHHNPYFIGIALGAIQNIPDQSPEWDNPRSIVIDRFTGRLVNFILGRLNLPLATREELR